MALVNFIFSTYRNAPTSTTIVPWAHSVTAWQIRGDYNRCITHTKLKFNLCLFILTLLRFSLPARNRTCKYFGGGVLSGGMIMGFICTNILSLANIKFFAFRRKARAPSCLFPAKIKRLFLFAPKRGVECGRGDIWIYEAARRAMLITFKPFSCLNVTLAVSSRRWRKPLVVRVPRGRCFAFLGLNAQKTSPQMRHE